MSLVSCGELAIGQRPLITNDPTPPQMSYDSKIDKLVEGALGEMQPGLMAKVSAPFA